MSMADGSADASNEKTTTPPAEGGQPPPKDTKAAPPPKADAKSVEGDKSGTGGGTGPGSGESAEDDPLGVYEKDGKKFVKMPYNSFKERLAKSTKKALKAIFGTSDTKAILEIKKQYDEFAADAEKRKKDEMTERQRLEAEKGEITRAKEVAERRAERLKSKLVVTKTHQKISKVAREFIKEDKREMALDLFKAALVGMSKRRADKLLGKEGEWFSELVKKNPEFGKGAPAAEDKSADTKSSDKADKKPANNGLPPNKGKPSAGGNGGTSKDVKNMTKAELQAYAKERGLNLPSLFG